MPNKPFKDFDLEVAHKLYLTDPAFRGAVEGLIGLVRKGKIRPSWISLVAKLAEEKLKEQEAL